MGVIGVKFIRDLSMENPLWRIFWTRVQVPPPPPLSAILEDDDLEVERYVYENAYLISIKNET